MRPRYVVDVEGYVTREGPYLMTVRSAAEAHAPGTLSVPGGKVEHVETEHDVLEATLRREIDEEVGIEIDAEVAYVGSNAFITDDGDPCVGIVFLCRHRAGEPVVRDPSEVAAI